MRNSPASYSRWINEAGRPTPYFYEFCQNLWKRTGSYNDSTISLELLTLGSPTTDGQFIVATGANALAYESGATARASLGLTIGTNVQAYDAGLASIAGLTTAADKFIYATASDAYAVADLTAFARTLLDDTTANLFLTTLTTTRSETGATAVTALNKFREVISVKDFGATGDGTTDDTAAIQAALDAVTTIGAIVYFPSGTYKTTSTITITKSVLLSGSGCAAKIAPNFGTTDVISVTGTSLAGPNGIVFDGIFIQPSVTRTAGYLLNLVSVNWAQLYDCRLFSGYNGLGITGAASSGLRVKDCKFFYNTNIQVNIIAQTATQGCIDAVFEDVLVSSSAVDQQAVAGITVTSAGDLTFRHVSTIWQAVGLNITPATGQVVQALFATGCFFDSGSNLGISIQPTGTGAVHLVKLTDVWSASNTTGGLTIGGAGTTEQTDIFNCTLSGNSGYGLQVDTNATNTSVVGGSMSGNTTHGIAIVAGTTKFKVRGATLGASGQFGGNGGWGILVNAGASDDYTITGNVVSGNTTGQISDGGTGKNKIVTNNLGGFTTPIGRISNIPVGAVAYGSLGTAVSHVAGTIYVAEIEILQAKTITGIGILNAGTVGTSLGIVALYGPDGGTALATSALGGAASSGADAFQQYAFTAALTIMNPGRYFIAFQANNATDNIRCIAASTYLNFTKSFTGSFGTIASLTVPTSTAADVGPIGYLY